MLSENTVVENQPQKSHLFCNFWSHLFIEILTRPLLIKLINATFYAIFKHCEVAKGNAEFYLRL